MVEIAPVTEAAPRVETLKQRADMALYIFNSDVSRANDARINVFTGLALTFPRQYNNTQTGGDTLAVNFANHYPTANPDTQPDEFKQQLDRMCVAVFPTEFRSGDPIPSALLDAIAKNGEHYQTTQQTYAIANDRYHAMASALGLVDTQAAQNNINSTYYDFIAPMEDAQVELDLSAMTSRFVPELKRMLAEETSYDDLFRQFKILYQSDRQVINDLEGVIPQRHALDALNEMLQGQRLGPQTATLFQEARYDMLKAEIAAMLEIAKKKQPKAPRESKSNSAKEPSGPSVIQQAQAFARGVWGRISPRLGELIENARQINVDPNVILHNLALWGRGIWNSTPVRNAANRVTNTMRQAAQRTARTPGPTREPNRTSSQQTLSSSPEHPFAEAVRALHQPAIRPEGFGRPAAGPKVPDRLRFWQREKVLTPEQQAAKEAARELRAQFRLLRNAARKNARRKDTTLQHALQNIQVQRVIFDTQAGEYRYVGEKSPRQQTLEYLMADIALSPAKEAQRLMSDSPGFILTMPSPKNPEKKEVAYLPLGANPNIIASFEGTKKGVALSLDTLAIDLASFVEGAKLTADEKGETVGISRGNGKEPGAAFAITDGVRRLAVVNSGSTARQLPAVAGVFESVGYLGEPPFAADAGSGSITVEVINRKGEVSVVRSSNQEQLYALNFNEKGFRLDKLEKNKNKRNMQITMMLRRAQGNALKLSSKVAAGAMGQLISQEEAQRYSLLMTRFISQKKREENMMLTPPNRDILFATNMESFSDAEIARVMLAEALLRMPEKRTPEEDLLHQKILRLLQDERLDLTRPENTMARNITASQEDQQKAFMKFFTQLTAASVVAGRVVGFEYGAGDIRRDTDTILQWAKLGNFYQFCIEQRIREANSRERTHVKDGAILLLVPPQITREHLEDALTGGRKSLDNLNDLANGIAAHLPENSPALMAGKTLPYHVAALRVQVSPTTVAQPAASASSQKTQI